MNFKRVIGLAARASFWRSTRYATRVVCLVFLAKLPDAVEPRKFCLLSKKQAHKLAPRGQIRSRNFDMVVESTFCNFWVLVDLCFRSERISLTRRLFREII